MDQLFEQEYQRSTVKQPAFMQKQLNLTTLTFCREQNLSTRKNLYPSETIVAGSWFTASDDTIEMSVEERFAKRLKLNLATPLSSTF